MQLSNIARDVGEDAAAGRLYLPRAWMDAAGIDVAEFLRKPRHSARLAEVVARLLDVAEASYARADAGIERLPLACRQGIRAARLLYAEIGDEVRRRGCDSVSTRAVVPPRRKLKILVRSLAAAPQASATSCNECTEQTRFLVTAAAAARPALPAGAMERTLTLFERLARRDQARRIGGAQLWETVRS
jgi:phytoene synthase